MSEYQICKANTADFPYYNDDALVCELPAADPSDASDFLEYVSSGGMMGSGGRMWKLGIDMPAIRTEYKQLVNQLVKTVDEMKAAGHSPKSIADYVVKERTGIARSMRLRQGVGPTVLFEMRDWSKYGRGGRTYSNMYQHYSSKGLRGSAIYDALIEGATKDNAGISKTAMRGAKYLKYGGRVILVVSVATTAYTLLTTPEDQLERVLYEEAGGLVGGTIGAGTAVGVCLLFGVATGGWGLLACGVVGGAGGGYLGSKGGENLYYTYGGGAEAQAESEGIIDMELIYDDIPWWMLEDESTMCVPE